MGSSINNGKKTKKNKQKKNNAVVGQKATQKSRIHADKYLRDTFDMTKVDDSSNDNMVDRCERTICE